MKKYISLLFLLLICYMANGENIPAVTNDSTLVRFPGVFQWEAHVKTGGMIQVGTSKRGVRRMIPITGGTFSGPEIKGIVLPFGEDWQLVRPDGDTELNAKYILKTEDGILIQVTNQALMHSDPASGSFYCKSVLDLEAPADSRYNQLNHAIFIGTLDFPVLKKNEEPYVIIRVYKLL